MSLPDHYQSQKSLCNSSEQVVPFTSVSVEEKNYMEPDLPNEKGAAIVEQKFVGKSTLNSETEEDQHYNTNNVNNSIDQQQLEMEGESTLLSHHSKEETEKDQQNHVPVEDQTNSDQYNLDLIDDLSFKCSTDQCMLQNDQDSNQQGPVSQFFQNVSKPQNWSSHYPLEVDTDMGYSSHSACSSCQQGSEVDSGQNNVNFTDTDYTEDCLNGDEEMEDLLFHFDRFFRNRYEELLTEQEMHVRQIVKKVIKTCSDKDCYTESVEVTDKATQTDEVEKFSVPSIIVDDTSCQACHRLGEDNQTEIKATPAVSDGSIPEHKDKLLLKVLSLTCAVTDLLQKKEYKT